MKIKKSGPSWITKNLRKAIKKNKAHGGNQKAEAELVEEHMKLGNQFIAGVVSLGIGTGKSKLKFGFQFYEPGDKGPFEDWKGF